MPTQLRDYQQTALDHIEQMRSHGHRRVTLPMPCGTGKTVVAAHLIAHTPGRAVMFVPTVELLGQTVRQLRADNPHRRVLAVCSDQHVGDEATESAEAKAAHLAVTTNADELAGNLSDSSVLVVSTYASGKIIAAATERADVTWQLMVCDEAHRTAGLANRLWSVPVHDEEIPAAFRLFMTATTRTIQPPALPEDLPDPEEVKVVSMDSVEEYGPHLPTLTMREAIDQSILSDYQVAIIGVDSRDVLELLHDHDEDSGDAPLDPQAAATQLALLHARDTHPELQSILAFHNRIIDSKQWCRQLRSLAKVDDRAEDIEVFHVDATSAQKHRTQALNALAHPGDRQVVVSNCRLFGEGVDVPALDAVLFAAPRSSTVDVVQIVGRALRKHPDKQGRKALIILPVVYSDDNVTDEATVAANSTFAAAWQVLMSLADVDDHVFRSVARLQMDSFGDTDDTPPTPTDTVSVDTSMLAVGASLPFKIRVLSHITGHHPQTVAMLRDWLAHTGNANPPVRKQWRDYPLGARVEQARKAKHEGRLDEKIVRLYEEIPGFQWERSTRGGRSAERWIELMERYINATGTTTIEPYSQVFDPDTGQKVAIGQRLHSYRWVRGLSEGNKQRLRQLGVGDVPGLK